MKAEMVDLSRCLPLVKMLAERIQVLDQMLLAERVMGEQLTLVEAETRAEVVTQVEAVTQVELVTQVEVVTQVNVAGDRAQIAVYFNVAVRRL